MASKEPNKIEVKKEMEWERLEAKEIFIQPMCIIYSKYGIFDFNNDVLEQIKQIKKPLVVVAIAGLYRTGKSYLMNRLAGYSKGFPLGSTIESKTKGIWAWCRKHPQIEDTCLLLLDTEGLGDVEKGDPGHDNKIFTLAALLCNVLIYNMMTAFNNDAVEKLTFISEISTNINFATAKDQLEMILPTFVLCLRDFTLDLEKQGREITADEYLDDSLKLKPGDSDDIARYNRPRESIKKYFPVRKCFTFDMPGSRKIIKELEKLQLDDLSETFVEETKAFLHYVYQQKPKALLTSKSVTGTMFVDLVITYVNAIKNGGVPDVDDAISVVANFENERLAEVAVKEFRKCIEEIELPILQREIFESIRQAKQDTALVQFRKEAVFNSEKFEIKAIDEMNKVWKVIKKQNLSLVENHCKSVLEKLYNNCVGEKNQRGEYYRINGHSAYKEDIDQFKTAYKRELEGTDEITMFGKYTCRKCKDPPKRFNFKGDCRRHIISYHYGFQYKCTGCGVMNSRKPEGTKHKCVKPGGEHILYHRETGCMGPEARKLLNQMNDKVDMDMEETIHFSQRPISPIRDPVLLGSHPYLPRPPVFERYKVHKVVKDIPKQKSTLASMPSLEDLSIPENVDFLAEKTASESVVLPEVEITEEDMAAVISSPARKVVVHQNSSEITNEQTVPVDVMPISEAPDYTDHFKKVLPQISELKEWNTYENRVTLCIGGKCFDTTSCTLMKEPTSVLALISGLAAIKSDNKIFIDRDPSHFKFIFNYLRYNLRMPAGCLPADPQVLHELRQEAEYYLLPKLVETIDWKIKSLRCTPAKQ